MTYDSGGSRTIRLRQDEPGGRSEAAQDRWDRRGGPEDRSWVRTTVRVAKALTDHDVVVQRAAFAEPQQYTSPCDR